MEQVLDKASTFCAKWRRWNMHCISAYWWRCLTAWKTSSGNQHSLGLVKNRPLQKTTPAGSPKKTWHALLTLLGLISKSCCKSTSSISITRKRLWNSASTRAPCMTSSRVNKPFFSRSMRSKIFWRNLGTNTSIEKNITTNETKQHHTHDMDIFAKQTQVQTQRVSNNPNMMSQSPGNLITHISVYFLLWVLIPTYTIHNVYI